MSPLDRESWTRISRILGDALELPESKRSAFLDSACEGDANLRAEVESLIAADTAAAAFLETPAGDAARELLDDEPQDEQPIEDPSSISVHPYALLRLLGRGGMGSVYLAERADGEFEQQVALKLVSYRGDGHEIERRFRNERQILAGLTHPNIARLLDGGVAGDGRPFFAMEYVDGEPITSWTDDEQLDVDGRLRLFEEVCAAVTYAQQRLVVHRDLKPSNILVDTEGCVKLLDFGVAKLLEEEASEQPHETRQLMTPEYAAPEQLRGEPVSMATDVYSLGVLLYELLSGHRPHGSGLVTVLQRRLHGGSTDPLSRAVARTAERSRSDGSTQTIDPQSVSRARATSPARLTKRLRGDLENIVSKSLEDDPEARYGTVAELREDIRCHMSGLPVAAVAPTFAYRAAKFIRRRALVLGAASLVLLSLLGGLIGVSWQARVARQEAARATAVRDLLIGLFRAQDPAESSGEDILASELLRRGTERVQTELEEQPELQSDMLQVLASLQFELGRYDEAEALHTRSLSMRQEQFGSEDSRVAESLVGLSAALFRKARYAEAESLATRALEVIDSGSGDDDLRSSALSNIAGAMRHQGRYEEAEPYYEAVLEFDRARHGNQHPAVAQDLSNQGVFFSDMGRYEEAESAYREALAIRQALYEPLHPDIAANFHNLGELLQTMGELDESEATLTDAIAIRRRIYPDGHPRLAASIRALGMTFQAKDDLLAAEAAVTEAMEMSRSLLGDRHEDVALCLNDLGVLAFFRSDLATAVERFRESLTIFEDLLPSDHPTVQTLRSNIATIELERGSYEAGETVYRDVLRIKIAKLGAEHPEIAMAKGQIGVALRLQGRAIEAQVWFREAVTIYEAAYGKESVDAAWARARMGETLADQGELDAAESELREALRVYEIQYPDGHRRVAEARCDLGTVQYLAGDLETAEATLRLAVEEAIAQVGEGHRQFGLSRFALGLALLARGDSDEGRALMIEGYAVIAETLPPRHPDRQSAERALAAHDR